MCFATYEWRCSSLLSANIFRYSSLDKNQVSVPSVIHSLLSFFSLSFFSRELLICLPLPTSYPFSICIFQFFLRPAFSFSFSLSKHLYFSNLFSLSVSLKSSFSLAESPVSHSSLAILLYVPLPLVFHVFPRLPLVFHVFPRLPLGFHVFLRLPLVFHAISRCSPIMSFEGCSFDFNVFFTSSLFLLFLPLSSSANSSLNFWVFQNCPRIYVFL